MDEDIVLFVFIEFAVVWGVDSTVVVEGLGEEFVGVHCLVTFLVAHPNKNINKFIWCYPTSYNITVIYAWTFICNPISFFIPYTNFSVWT